MNGTGRAVGRSGDCWLVCSRGCEISHSLVVFLPIFPSFFLHDHPPPPNALEVPKFALIFNDDPITFPNLLIIAMN